MKQCMALIIILTVPGLSKGWAIDTECLQKTFVNMEAIPIKTHILLSVLGENPQDEADHEHLETVLGARDVALHGDGQLDQLPVYIGLQTTI